MRGGGGGEGGACALHFLLSQPIPKQLPHSAGSTSTQSTPPSFYPLSTRRSHSLHKACMATWVAAKKNSGEVPCPFCRKPWVAPGSAGVAAAPAAAAASASSSASSASMSAGLLSGKRIGPEGYYNLAAEAGLSTKRDTST